MSDSNPSIVIPLIKVDEERRLVVGRAASEVVDKSREIMDYASSKPEFEKWSSHIEELSGGKSKGNLRSMHGKIAAGKLVELTFNDAEKAIDVVAKVTDDNEWKKVLDGIYTGFSIGGGYGARWQDPSDPTVTRYTAKPSELSLVDNPCMPTARFFDLVKADGQVERRQFAAMADPSLEGMSGPVGSEKPLMKEEDEEESVEESVDIPAGRGEPETFGKALRTERLRKVGADLLAAARMGKTVLFSDLVKREPRDGNGNGMVFDGTPQERPVSGKAVSRTKASWYKSGAKEPLSDKDATFLAQFDSTWKAEQRKAAAERRQEPDVQGAIRQEKLNRAASKIRRGQIKVPRKRGETDDAYKARALAVVGAKLKVGDLQQSIDTAEMERRDGALALIDEAEGRAKTFADVMAEKAAAGDLEKLGPVSGAALGAAGGYLLGSGGLGARLGRRLGDYAAGVIRGSRRGKAGFGSGYRRAKAGKRFDRMIADGKKPGYKTIQRVRAKGGRRALMGAGALGAGIYAYRNREQEVGKAVLFGDLMKNDDVRTFGEQFTEAKSQAKALGGVAQRTGSKAYAAGKKAVDAGRRVIDRDGDGKVFDGTKNERPARPEERSKKQSGSKTPKWAGAVAGAAAGLAATTGFLIGRGRAARGARAVLNEAMMSRAAAATRKARAGAVATAIEDAGTNYKAASEAVNKARRILSGEAPIPTAGGKMLYATERGMKEADEAVAIAGGRADEIEEALSTAKTNLADLERRIDSKELKDAASADKVKKLKATVTRLEGDKKEADAALTAAKGERAQIDKAIRESKATIETNEGKVEELNPRRSGRAADLKYDGQEEKGARLGGIQAAKREYKEASEALEMADSELLAAVKARYKAADSFGAEVGMSILNFGRSAERRMPLPKKIEDGLRTAVEELTVNFDRVRSNKRYVEDAYRATYIDVMAEAMQDPAGAAKNGLSMAQIAKAQASARAQAANVAAAIQKGELGAVKRRVQEITTKAIAKSHELKVGVATDGATVGNKLTEKGSAIMASVGKVAGWLPGAGPIMDMVNKMPPQVRVQAGYGLLMMFSGVTGATLGNLAVQKVDTVDGKMEFQIVEVDPKSKTKVNRFYYREGQDAAKPTIKFDPSYTPGQGGGGGGSNNQGGGGSANNEFASKFNGKNYGEIKGMLNGMKGDFGSDPRKRSAAIAALPKSLDDGQLAAAIQIITGKPATDVTVDGLDKEIEFGLKRGWDDNWKNATRKRIKAGGFSDEEANALRAKLNGNQPAQKIAPSEPKWNPEEEYRAKSRQKRDSWIKKLEPLEQSGDDVPDDFLQEVVEDDEIDPDDRLEIFARLDFGGVDFGDLSEEDVVARVYDRIDQNMAIYDTDPYRAKVDLFRVTAYPKIPNGARAKLEAIINRASSGDVMDRTAARRDFDRFDPASWALDARPAPEDLLDEVERRSTDIPPWEDEDNYYTAKKATFDRLYKRAKVVTFADLYRG